MIAAELIKPLPKKKLEFSDWYKQNHPHKIKVIKRVMFFNPKKIYKRIADKLDPYKRHMGLQMDDVFPKIPGKCACGCKKTPPHGEDWCRKWATPDCQSFASDVLSIINNYFGVAAKYITHYYGKKCIDCDSATTSEADLELDHIVGVKHGGGGSWLSNYVWRCKKCHRDKTNKDFKWGNHKDTSQLKLL